MRFKEYKEGGKTSEDKKIYAYNYYLKKGVPAVQAAGIVGNLAAESGLNTTVTGKADNKGSKAIAQWHSERLEGLKRFAGNKWTTLDSQLDYVLYELNTTEKKAKASLFAAKTPQEATIAFMNDYERPAEWAKKQSGSKRVNESLKLLGLKPDSNYTYGSEEQNNPYRFSEYKKTDYYAPQVSENISSLDNTQETTNLAEDKATEIKNRLEQKKAEKALLQQMILATQVAYVNPADYQSQPTFEDIQEEQIFQTGGISQFKKKPFTLKDERVTVSKDNTKVGNYNNARLFNPNVRNKTDKEIAQERETKIKASTDAQKIPYTKENWRQQLAKETEATGDKLRVSLEPNFFDDYLNPAVMVGNMASNLGQAPLQAEQSDSVLPYVTSIGTPLAVGAMAGLGAQSTGQFVNNLANPLAGTGDLVNNLGNKYLPNAYKVNPSSFKTSADKFYRQVDNTTYNEGLESGLIRGKQDVDMTKGKDIINLNKSFGDDAYYNKGSLYYKDNKDLPYLFEANLPEENFIPKVNGRTRKYTTENTSVRVSKEPLPINDPNITIYKKDWLKGYKPVEFKNGGEKNSLWKNIRANRGSGRKPTKEMLEQERKIKRKEDGGVIEDDRGQWAHPGAITKINSGNITMEGVNYPVYGVDNLGNSQMMYPGQNYQFPGTSVIEYPQIKSRIKTNRFSK